MSVNQLFTAFMALLLTVVFGFLLFCLLATIGLYLSSPAHDDVNPVMAIGAIMVSAGLALIASIFFFAFIWNKLRKRYPD